MDFDKKYSCLEKNCLVCKKNVDIENDFQETLQQFSSDIYRVVKCSCHGYITSIDVAENCVVVNGKIQLNLTYYNEESVLSYADFEENFSKTVDVDGVSQSAFATARIYDKYTSFRVINQRRIDIHCAHCMTVLVYDKTSTPCLSACNGSRLKYESIDCVNVVNTSHNKIEFDEEMQINSSVNRIINQCAYATVVDTKMIKDKALIKIHIRSVINYTTGDEDCVDTTEKSFELSKIVEIPGIDEDDIMIPCAAIGSLYAKTKSTGDNSSSVIQLYGDAVITTTIVRKSQMDVVTDGYILNHRCDCRYDKCCMSVDGRLQKDSETYNLSFSFNNDICEVKSCQLCLLDYCVRDCTIVMTFSLNVLCINLEGSVVCYSSTAQTQVGIGNHSDAIAGISINSFDYTLSSANCIDVRVILDIDAFVYNNREVNLLSELDTTDEVVDYPALTVYFAKQNESVWNIAKCFSSDIALIQKENNLTSDVLDCNKILLIPGV